MPGETDSQREQTARRHKGTVIRIPAAEGPKHVTGIAERGLRDFSARVTAYAAKLAEARCQS